MAVQQGKRPAGRQRNLIEARLKLANFHGGQQQIGHLAFSKYRHGDSHPQLFGDRPKNNIADSGLARFQRCRPRGAPSRKWQPGQFGSEWRSRIEKHLHPQVGQNNVTTETLLKALRLTVKILPA